jgi:branched-chain amino acid transport system substrate-binding protein
MKHLLMAYLIILFSVQYVEAAEPIKIGLSLGLTGQYAEMASMQNKSFRLWEKDVNSKGGILGRKVNFIIHDDKSDPETAKMLYEQMITKDKIDLLFAPYSTDLTEAILPITEKYGYPIIPTGASADSLWQKGYRNIFGLYTVAGRYAVGFLEMLVRNKLDSIAIVYTHDGFSQSIAEGTRHWAEKFGLTIHFMDGYKQGTKDFSSSVKKAEASKTNAVILCAHFDEAVDMRTTMKKAGWYPKAYYASIAPALPKYREKLGADADYTFSTVQWEPHRKFPGSEKFRNDFYKTYGIIPSYQAANAYAAGQILEKAIKKTETLNRKAIREVLSTMNAISIIGMYGVDKTGRQTRHSPLIIQWQKGKKEIVWPEDFRTAKPIFDIKRSR